MNREGKLHTLSCGTQMATDGHTATFAPPDWINLAQVAITRNGPTTTQILSGQPTLSHAGSEAGSAKRKAPKKPHHKSASKKPPKKRKH
jgi:hypothetical protein